VITTQGSTQMTTLLGLKPGDDIILGPRRGTPTGAGNFTVSFATYPGATNYTVYGPCGGTNSTASPVVLPMQSDCKQDTMDLFVVAYDANGNPLASLTKTGVTFAAGGSTAITGTYQGVSNFTASYTNVPAVVTEINYTRQLPDDFGFTRGGGGAPSGGTYSSSAPAVQGQAAIVLTSISTASGAEQTLQQSIQGNALTYGRDVGATLLPWLGSPMVDFASHKVTVAVDPTGTSGDLPDVFAVQTSYSRTVDQTTQRFGWIALGPTPGDIVLPTMPPEVGDVMPKDGDILQTALAISLESDAIDSYDTIRQDIFSTIQGVDDPIHPMAVKTRQCSNFIQTK
jgi:hypothetical protein